MRLLILNGPNINMIGIRQTDIYGEEKYKDLTKRIKKYSKQAGVFVSVFQYNSEEKIVHKIQKNYDKYDGFIINLGAFTHYSYAIRDAIELINKPIVEVHISDINNREEFRKISVIQDLVDKQIIGKGTNGYFLAIDYLIGDIHD